MQHDEQLLVLLTDQGFAYRPDYIWETLSSTFGESIFLNSRFRPSDQAVQAECVRAARVQLHCV